MQFRFSLIQLTFSEVLDDLHGRLRNVRWPEEVPGTGWTRGVDLKFMKDPLSIGWKSDWRKQEAKLNELPHYKADVDGLGLHFIHVKGKDLIQPAFYDAWLSMVVYIVIANPTYVN